MNDPFFTCSFIPNTDDLDNVLAAYNQGIDSRLEGFTQSQHEWTYNNGPRLHFYIANAHEFQILVRRLLEMETWKAENLADDMIRTQYNCEVEF